MGSQIVKSGVGRPENLEKKGHCDCDEDNYDVNFMRWDSFSLPNSSLVTLGRVVTLGIPEIWYKFQSYSHDCI